jgi:hypothetical protein
MELPRRKFLHFAAGAAALPALARVAKAQAYPARTVTIIVPVAAVGERTLPLASSANTCLGCSDSNSSLRMCLGPAA